MSDCYPAITRLSLHLPGEHTVFYVNTDGLRRQFETGQAERTTLTEYFNLNVLNTAGLGCRARTLLYQDIPQFYWFTKDKRWHPRVSPSDAIGRIFYASPNDGECYYLRLLLLNIRGATSFRDLCTIDGRSYQTFRAAARAAGLLLTDSHLSKLSPRQRYGDVARDYKNFSPSF
jgi:hypothetical protein